MFKSFARAAALVLAFAALPAQAADDISIRINFTPWGMHAPIFAAKGQGFYEAEGINLSIVPPSQGQQNEVFIARGSEQFGLSNSDSFLKARANGLPVVAIMADQPATPIGIISLEGSNITKPADLKGKKLSWIQSNVTAMLDPLLESGGLTRDDIELVNVTRGAEVQLLAAGEIDAVYGFTYGQALTLEERGIPVNVLPLKDYGLDIYGTVFYTNETILRDNPDLVERFLRATLKGYQWASSHQREATALVIQASPDRDLDLETRKLGIVYDIYRAPDYQTRFGTMSAAKWNALSEVLSEDIPAKPEADALFTNQFVEKLPEAAELAELLKKPAN